MNSAIMAFLHHIFAFGLTACLVYELVTFRRELTLEDARKIQRADLLYGVSSGLLLVVGLLRVFYFEKGAAFYMQSPFFWVKMGTFLIVGLLSISPTIRFLRWNSLLKQDQVPVLSEAEYVRTRRLLWLEVTGIAVILLSASLMARGIGFN